MSRFRDNKALRYCKALEVAIKLAENPLLIADLTELRDKLSCGHLQWRGGVQAAPNKPKEALESDS